MSASLVKPKPSLHEQPHSPRAFALNRMELQIVYTEDAVLLSKQSQLSWRELQVAIPGYKASLGPWSQEEVVEYLRVEYADLEPAAAVQVESFLQSQKATQELVFRAYTESIGNPPENPAV